MPGQWHTLTGGEVARLLAVDPAQGLGEKEAEARYREVGPNDLPRQQGVPLWQMFFHQFRDFMVLVLLAATAISGLLGEYADAVTILLIVVLNAALGVLQEYRAEKSLAALQKLTAPEARVLRGGMEKKILAARLVPGDIVLLEAGDRVPADLRLLQAAQLEVEESILSGESMPVRKDPAVAGSGAGEHRNMAFMGTMVTRGRGRGVVVATGLATAMGQIARLLAGTQQESTPLQRRLAQLGGYLVAFCLLICAAVVVLGVYRGAPLYNMFLAGVSLAVAAIPEGLPAIVTVVLAVGVQRMARRQAIVRRLPAVETLGCATVICADKTGTITQNKMQVRQVVTAGGTRAEITGQGYEPRGRVKLLQGREGRDWQLLMQAAAICNNALLKKGGLSIGGFFRSRAAGMADGWQVQGDPTEGALLVMAARCGYWREKLLQPEDVLAELPFESERKRMTVLVREKTGPVAYTKGAPDVLLELCTQVCRGEQIVPLTDEIRKEIIQQHSEMAAAALRVLAFAWRPLPSGEGEYSPDTVEREMVFLGLAGMYDPPRPQVSGAVALCRRAGIKTVMITGDHSLTAQAVAQEIGLLGRGDQILTGQELDRLSDQELSARADKVSLYARVSPQHKLRIVRALQENGHVVAMTGDGVNDAPAVKKADIGIAMGQSGTDVTREAAGMVLADDDFSTIVAAVEEGRGIYDNIRKFIRYLLSCNVGEVLVMFVAVLAGLPLPLLPMQILWMNLVTDGLPAMALGMDPYDRDIMYRPPRRPRESIFAGGLGWRILGSGMLIAAGTLLIFVLAWYQTHQLDLARTMAFNTLVFFQLFYVFSCRSEHHSIWEVGLTSNPYLLLAVGVSTALQLLVNYVPLLQRLFHVVPLPAAQWGLILLVTALSLLLGTVYKMLQKRLREKIMYLRV
ncbi:MAG: calcium-translocating P-type ATPase, SERCA-type [Desulfurispora sp.]|uniref:calcium-translocating P-type ATPase, SERCA-type n=1 Tax=Desulfurispora sp. TaxID=3014275 RepID=UPI004049D0F7